MAGIYRLNLHTNPVVGIDTTDWALNRAGGTAGLLRQTAGGPSGIDTWAKLNFTVAPTTSPAAIHTSSNTLATGLSATPGVTYSARGYAYSTQAGLTGVRLDLSWYDNTATLISTTSGTTTAIAANTWETRDVSGAAPAGTVFARVSMTFSGPNGVILAGDYLGTTGIVLEAVKGQRNYFDGGVNLDTYGTPAWLGDPHASQSALLSPENAMVDVFNTAEGGTDNTTVTTANSGGASGDPFGSLTINGVLTFTKSASYTGNYSYYLAPSGAANVYVTYTCAAANYYTGSLYVNFLALPSAATQFMRFYDVPNNRQVGAVIWNSNAKVSVQSGGTSLDTSTNTMPLNTWLRVELTVALDPGTGGMVCVSVYAGEDSDSPLYAFVSTSANTGTSQLLTFMAGKASATGTWDPFFIDSIHVADVLGMGPQYSAPVGWLQA